NKIIKKAKTGDAWKKLVDLITEMRKNESTKEFVRIFDNLFIGKIHEIPQGYMDFILHSALIDPKNRQQTQLAVDEVLRSIAGKLHSLFILQTAVRKIANEIKQDALGNPSYNRLEKTAAVTRADQSGSQHDQKVENTKKLFWNVQNAAKAAGLEVYNESIEYTYLKPLETILF
ncbi:MAG: hypothetical protein NUV82_00990, partial [Candidatus Komeilibacteria bacterium]|nr:hypothetical protein [Candidatus Komeilibacteria bacterium]